MFYNIPEAGKIPFSTTESFSRESSRILPPAEVTDVPGWDGGTIPSLLPAAFGINWLLCPRLGLAQRELKVTRGNSLKLEV